MLTGGSVIVVPCYNEEERLDVGAFLRCSAEHPGVRFLFVNDGSTDGTLALLRNIRDAAGKDAVFVLDLRVNQGKGEAVRCGMLAALELQPSFIGYWDADLATPLTEIARFARLLEQDPRRLLVMGARVQLLGRTIVRSPVRHYLGRVFATAASVALRLPVYDTQCGAKLLRVTAGTRALFAEPFHSRWIFDVEILARLIGSQGPDGHAGVAAQVYECPLNTWVDAGGSKVRGRDFLQAAVDLYVIHSHYLRGRRAGWDFLRGVPASRGAVEEARNGVAVTAGGSNAEQPAADGAPRHDQARRGVAV